MTEKQKPVLNRLTTANTYSKNPRKFEKQWNRPTQSKRNSLSQLKPSVSEHAMSIQGNNLLKPPLKSPKTASMPKIQEQADETKKQIYGLINSKVQMSSTQNTMLTNPERGSYKNIRSLAPSFAETQSGIKSPVMSAMLPKRMHPSVSSRPSSLWDTNGLGFAMHRQSSQKNSETGTILSNRNQFFKNLRQKNAESNFVVRQGPKMSKPPLAKSKQLKSIRQTTGGVVDIAF